MTCQTSPASPLVVYQGATYIQVWRWAIAPYVYKSISAIPSLTPLTVTATAHGVPNGWPVAFTEVGGLTALNAADWPPNGSDFNTATVVDVNTLAFNEIDAARIGAYTSGGQIAYLTPVSLTGVTAQFAIYAYPAPSTYADPLPAPIALVTISATIDAVNDTITVTIPAATSATLAQGQYQYTLIATDSSGNVTVLDQGVILLQVPGTTGIPTL